MIVYVILYFKILYKYLSKRYVKLYVYSELWIGLIIVFLFIIILNWKEFKCLLIVEWINILLFVYIIECFFIIKNE